MSDSDSSRQIGELAGSGGAAFVLERDLSEVYLLLDYISSDTRRTLNDAESVSADSKTLNDLLGPDFIERLSRIRWPPGPAARDDVPGQVAMVIKAKDLLNRHARPATGFTIAFTELVTAEDDDIQSPSLLGAIPIALLGLWRGLFGSRRPGETRGGPDADNGAGGGPPVTPSRAGLARDAYPNLVPRAAAFRRTMWIMSILLILWLVLTCWMSWYAAFGGTTLAQLASVKTNLAAAEEKVRSVEVSYTAGDESFDKTSQAPTSATALAGNVVPLCERWRTRPAQPGIERVYGDVREMQACQSVEQASAEVVRVRRDLSNWLDCGPFHCSSVFVPWLMSWTGAKTPRCACDACAACDDGAKDYYANILATLLATSVLPVLYGFLGAGAAIVRTLSTKMEHSLLEPRDLTLSIQKLALGAVVGACISLFVSSPDAKGQGDHAMIGAIALSGSALSFLAGFSVEAAFTALERLVNHVFDVPSPTKGRQ